MPRSASSRLVGSVDSPWRIHSSRTTTICAFWSSVSVSILFIRIILLARRLPALLQRSTQAGAEERKPCSAPRRTVSLHIHASGLPLSRIQYHRQSMIHK